MSALAGRPRIRYHVVFSAYPKYYHHGNSVTAVIIIIIIIDVDAVLLKIGIDQALWDIAGKVLKAPIHRVSGSGDVVTISNSNRQ